MYLQVRALSVVSTNVRLMKRTTDADGGSGGRGPLETPSAVFSATDATGPVGAMRAMDAALSGLTEVSTCDATRVGGGQAVALLGGLDRARALADTATLKLVIELIDRGEAPGTGHGLVDWLSARCSAMPRSHAVDLVRIAVACAAERGVDRSAHAPVLDAVSSGAVSVRRGSMVMRALGRIRPVLDDATYAQDVALVLDAAARRETFTERDLTRITEKLVATAMSERDHEHRDQVSAVLRGVSESSLADGSVIRFLVDADPEGAGVIRAVMSSALAAPTPAPDGTPDRRTAAARRYDALITVLGRGMASPEGQPTTARTQLIVTVPFDLLAQAVRDGQAGQGAGAVRDGQAGQGAEAVRDGQAGQGAFGPGFTATGDMVSPATVRRLACDAQLIPAVLGGHGEILDLGRAQRLVTAGQRRALAHRDVHCSFTGCSVPAGWCDAHHIVHWANGGRSDLSNYALLCQRHHTHVHQNDLTATVDGSAPPGTAVRWRQRE